MTRPGPRDAARLARVAAVGVALGLAACGAASGGSADDLEVTEAWAAEADEVAAVYLTITNGGDADRLVGASAAGVGAVSLMGGGGADAGAHPAGSRPVDLAVPPGTTELAPGGRHLMLDGLRAPLRPGDRLPLTLELERAGARTVEVEVLGWDAVVDRLSETGTARDGAAEGATPEARTARDGAAEGATPEARTPEDEP